MFFFSESSSKGGLTSNFGILMAQLIIDEKAYGVQAFIVQLRSLENHRHLPGVETGDIGPKIGFDSLDNGYIKFDQYRIPRSHMLMRYSWVTKEGVFEKSPGTDLVMYASMLILRAKLSLFSALILTSSMTIAIRYSCVRRQTGNPDGYQ
jgi:acyl-CoA oxidase